MRLPLQIIGVVIVMFACGFLLAMCADGFAQSPAYERFTCDLERVVDGDTVRVLCPWPAPVARQSLRVAEIDAPESFNGTKGAKCQKELRLGLIAKAWAKRQFLGSPKLTFEWRSDRGVSGRDNSGRLLVNVILPSGKYWAKEAIRTGNAIFYDPDISKSFAKPDWCK